VGFRFLGFKDGFLAKRGVKRGVKCGVKVPSIGAGGDG